MHHVLRPLVQKRGDGVAECGEGGREHRQVPSPSVGEGWAKWGRCVGCGIISWDRASCVRCRGGMVVTEVQRQTLFCEELPAWSSLGRV